MKNNTLQNMKLNLRRSAKFFAAALMITFMSSCEQIPGMEDVVKDKDKDKDKGIQYFVADLHPLNNSGVTGTATFKYREGGDFIAKVNADGLVPGKVHPQHIHFKGECPPASAAGADGLLTLPEGLPFYGEIFVPLDDKLVPIRPVGAGDFPVANSVGVITYVETTDLGLLISAIDEHYPKDVSLEDLNLAKRTVVLHGAFVKDGEIVPPGTEGAEYVATLPVACGEIREVL